MLLFGVPASEPRTVCLLRGGADSLKQAEGCSGSKNWRTYRRTTKMPDASILHERLRRKRLLIVVGNSKIAHQVRDIEASFFDATVLRGGDGDDEVDVDQGTVLQGREAPAWSVRHGQGKGASANDTGPGWV